MASKLPVGMCGKCGRTDVLLFKREYVTIGKTKHSVISNEPDSTLLTYHDDKEGLRCDNGGQEALEFRLLSEFVKPRK